MENSLSTPLLKSRVKSRHSIFRIVIGALMVLITLGTPFYANARNLSGRLGAGATHVGPGEGTAPLFSILYHQGISSSFGGLFGIDTQTSTNTLMMGAQYKRNLFIEEQLNFYVGMSGGLLTKTPPGATSASGYLLEAVLGSEAFLTGLPNLGIHVASGFRLESPGGARLKTVFYCGMHYYF